MAKFYAAFQATKTCFKLSKVIESFDLQVTYLKSTSEMLPSVSFRSSTIKNASTSTIQCPWMTISAITFGVNL